jgi:hypothetical protein
MIFLIFSGQMQEQYLEQAPTVSFQILSSSSLILKRQNSLEPMGILIVGSMTCFLIDEFGGEAQWSGHHDRLTSTPWTLHLGDS